VPELTIYGVDRGPSLPRATYVPGAIGTSDDIYVEALRRQRLFPAGNSTVHVAAINHDPVVAGVCRPNALGGRRGTRFRSQALFGIGSDQDGDTLTYYLYDATSDAKQRSLPSSAARSCRRKRFTA